MKKLNIYILVGITNLILICSFLIPITKAQEWIYDGVDTPIIPGFSVYPTEFYVLNWSEGVMPPNHLYLLEILKGNISDYMGSGNGTCVWGDHLWWNTTSGEKTIVMYNVLIGYWNESVGFLSSQGPPYIIPVENNGKVSLPILNNVSDFIELLISSWNFEHRQVFPNIYSIAFWNTSYNTAYYKTNYTDDGIIIHWETYLVPFLLNLTLYSQLAQLFPDFSFTAEDDTLIVNSTDFKIKTTINDADNNNDGVTDTDYSFRILNGSSWTNWAAPTSLLDWDLGSVAAGNYSITMEVKNMYGVTQEQVTFEYIPPEVIPDGDGFISSYPIALVSIVAILGITIIIYRHRKKLRI